jgi:hypothetical protein
MLRGAKGNVLSMPHSVPPREVVIMAARRERVDVVIIGVGAAGSVPAAKLVQQRSTRAKTARCVMAAAQPHG